MQRLIFGLANGSIYSLMALAIGMIYSTTGITNFAHASVIMLGAMTGYWCIALFGLPYLLSLLIAIAVTVASNIIIYKLCVEQLGDLSKQVGWIVTTFGASIILDNVARMVFGTEPQSFPYLFEGKAINILGANIMLHEVMMILIAIFIGTIYETMMQKTRFGRAIRAVSFRPDTARLMGIKSETVILSCFAMAGAVASVAGVLIAPITFASYTMTASIGIKGFAAALIGGLGNSKGAFIGGLTLGVIEAVVGTFVPAGFKDAISFLIMIIVIIFLPGGILSAKFFKKGASSAEKI